VLSTILLVREASNARAQIGEVPRLARVLESEARTHLISRSAIFFDAPPRLAETSYVYVSVSIAPSGLVQRATALCGPMEYRSAVEKSIERWLFSPFLSSSGALTVDTVLTNFIARGSPPTADEIAKHSAFADAIPDCESRMDRDPQRAANACQQLYDVAGKGMGRYEQAYASQLLAKVRLSQSQWDEAIRLADHSVSLFRPGQDRTLAVIESARIHDSAGRHKDAATEYGNAIADLRNEYRSAQGPAIAIVGDRLRDTLTEYADLLDRAGDGDAAQTMRAERDRMK
jgi:hypothetical protein